MQTNWRWTKQDKKQIIEVLQKSQQEFNISNIFLISESLITNDDLKSIRVAAARLGADSVMIINGIADVDRYFNNFGWTYFLILPALFIPGSERETMFLANATMWDVGNEFLYLAADSEGKSSTTCIPAFCPRDEDLVEKSKSEALNNLTKEIVDMMKGIKK